MGAAGLLLAIAPLRAQQPATAPVVSADSDNDGLSDALEQRLLDQFTPRFMVGEQDCSVSPAEFQTGLLRPEVKADNGTIYGQVSPVKGSAQAAPAAEIHYYHLWRKDCGGHGHPLDTEHVAVLIRASDTDLSTATWKADYWYAAAHEDTVCDVSQIARAATLDAQDRGAAVWVSPGKHASYLNETLCRRGCGADRCEKMVALPATAPINLGEPNHPANGSLFISAKEWPLMAKMSATNFPAAAVARLNQLPETDIAWFHPGRHPAQGIIARSNVTAQAITDSGRNTTTAISLAANSTGDSLATANDSTADAIAVAGAATGKALKKSSGKTIHALGVAARSVRGALNAAPKDKGEAPR